MKKVLWVMCGVFETRGEILEALAEASKDTVILNIAVAEDILALHGFLDISASDLFLRIREPKGRRNKRPDDRWYRLMVKGSRVRPSVHRMPGHRTFPSS